MIDPFDRNAQLIVPGPGHRAKQAVENHSVGVDGEDGLGILADRAGPFGVDTTFLGKPAGDRVGPSDRVDHVVGRGTGQATIGAAVVYPNAAEVAESFYRVGAVRIVVNFVAFRAGVGVTIGCLDPGASIAQGNARDADPFNNSSLGRCMCQYRYGLLPNLTIQQLIWLFFLRASLNLLSNRC